MYCKLIPAVAFMNEKGGKINFPLVWQIPRQRSFPFRPPPPFGMSCLFVFGGSHFSSSPLPGLEVLEETKAGSSLGGWLTLPHGCARPGKRFQPPSAAERRQPEAKGTTVEWFVLRSSPVYTSRSNHIPAPLCPMNGSLENAESLKLKVLRNF